MWDASPEVTMQEVCRQFQIGSLAVYVYPTKEALGRAAAQEATVWIQEATRRRGKARVLFSAANSQMEMIGELTTQPGIDWHSVEAFHIDEYFGLATSHPASFGGWLKRNVDDKVHPGRTHYLAGDAIEIAEECRRFAKLISQEPIDLSFLGIGENGHLGFNDPHEADFADPETVRVVTLDERCRLQLVGEGPWSDISQVPTKGITITCPSLVDAAHIVSCVPGPRKAEAVRDALEGPISPCCPASLLRTCNNAKLYLDVDSASLLSQRD